MRMNGVGSRGGSTLILLVSLAACERPSPPPGQPGAPGTAAEPRPELVLESPGGTGVWFGDSREGHDSAGTPCTERTLEVRGPGGRQIVPLLYTLDTPTVLDDTTIRARLFTNCRPGATYRVDLRTGLPTRKDP